MKCDLGFLINDVVTEVNGTVGRVEGVGPEASDSPVHEDSKALVIWIPNRAAMNNIDVIVVITASALKCGNCHYR